MKVVISIKKEYSDKILSGEKMYEYRRTMFNDTVKTVVMYETKPTGMLVGEFSISYVLCNTPEEIWEDTSSYAGISKEGFDKYFTGKENSMVYAIVIDKVTKYEVPLNPYQTYSRFKPPQSFMYV